MEIPPISAEEIEQEWTRLRQQFQLPDEKRYIAENMLIIQKCFGDGAYVTAYAKLQQDQLQAAKA